MRRDVDVSDVEAVLELERSTVALATLERVFTTHPMFSAARWYVHWVRGRLGRVDLTYAWMEWEAANRRLAELLKLPAAERLGVVAGEEDCQSDAFLWLLVDCVGARLFHDAAESEHFADLAVAAVEGRWRREKPSRGHFSFVSEGVVGI